MKRLGNIYKEIISFDNLVLAHKKARKKKSHYTEVQDVDSNLENRIKNLHFILSNEIYYVNKNDYKTRKIIDKGKEREIMALPYYPHRIVQWAIMNKIEERLLKSFVVDTYASISGRGSHLCLSKLKKVLVKKSDETIYCLKLDIKKYYPSIDNDILFGLVQKIIKDKQLLRLLKIIIFSTGTKGQPIGSLLSQWFGNLYLNGLDHYIKENLKTKYYYRYCDDIVILGSDKGILREKLNLIRNYLENVLKLDLKENYQIFPIDKRGIDFLGYRVFRGYVLLRKRVLKQMKKKLSKISSKNKLSYNEHCVLNSYCGWIKHCNHNRLFDKYIKQFHNKKYINSNGIERRINVVCHR